MLETQPIDEIAEFLRNSEARSDALFDNELAFVTEWNCKKELYHG